MTHQIPLHAPGSVQRVALAGIASCSLGGTSIPPGGAALSYGLTADPMLKAAIYIGLCLTEIDTWGVYETHAMGEALSTWGVYEMHAMGEGVSDSTAVSAVLGRMLDSPSDPRAVLGSQGGIAGRSPGREGGFHWGLVSHQDSPDPLGYELSRSCVGAAPQHSCGESQGKSHAA